MDSPCSGLWLLPLLLATACSVGPDYQRPTVTTPPAYKEEGWKVAEPNDAIERGAWWAIYQDPVLDGLERQVAASNQTVAAAEASFRNARALANQANASFFPTLSASASAKRSGPLETTIGSDKSAASDKVANSVGLGLDASWVPDVWGKIARAKEASSADAEVSLADLAAARLSAQSDLATDYFELRTADELKKLLETTLAAYGQSVDIARNRYGAGTAPQSDVLSAQAQVEATRSQLVAVGVTRAQFEHAIAVLVGKPPAELTIAPAVLPQAVPKVPAGLPSALLERRPDIAAAERKMAEANAKIGVAEAAYYPDLTLSGTLTSTGAALSNLAQASNAAWSLGSQLAATLFDGGARDAGVVAARAVFDQNVATYRQTVLAAFQQVEDELAAERILTDEASVQDQAVRLAQEAERLTLNQYRAGTLPYTNVLTAQTTSLAEQQTALTIRQNRLVASVKLIEALGGGWSAGTSDRAM